MTIVTRKFGKAWLMDLSKTRPDVRREYRDTENRYLRARVSPTGKVSMSVYKCPAGSRKAVRVSVGITVNDAMPDIKELRRQANLIVGQLDQGINPNRPKLGSNITLQQALDNYLKDARIRESTKLGYRQRIEKHLSVWLNLPLGELVRKATLLAEHRRIANTTPIAANNALQVLRRILNYTRALHDSLPGWPTEDLARLGLWAEQKARDRKIHPKEFPEFWQALNALQDAEQKDYFKFLLLTGCRRREALNLSNANLDSRRQELTFRSTKNGEDHTLPYTQTLLKILDRRQEVVGKAPLTRLFTLAEPKSITKHIRKSTGMHITPHDLRRTFAAVGNTVTSTAILKALLNHKSGLDVTDDYIGEIDSETLRDALLSIEDKISALTQAPIIARLEVTA